MATHIFFPTGSYWEVPHIEGKTSGSIFRVVGTDCGAVIGDQIITESTVKQAQCPFRLVHTVIFTQELRNATLGSPDKFNMLWHLLHSR